MNTSCPAARGLSVSSAWSLILNITVAALALALALPAWSQGSGSYGAGSSSTSGSAATRSTGSRTAEEDRERLEDLAHAHLAEIETGRLALEKSQNTQVRTYAQQMIDDHQKAYQELQQLAQKKQLTVPTETDFQHKAIATALRLLSGALFDKQYLQQVGINDHRRTVDLLQKMQVESQDPELKVHAGKLLPVVQRHLSMAREMEQKMK